MSAHVHAASIALFAQDAAEMAKPWTRWQQLAPTKAEWEDCAYMPTWAAHMQFRRKPVEVVLRASSFPAPLRKPLERGTEFWVASTSEGVPTREIWSGSPTDLALLDDGVAHATMEAAAAHLTALLSLTRQAVPA